MLTATRGVRPEFRLDPDDRQATTVRMAAARKRQGLRREQRELSEQLRADGATWVEIATEFQRRYHLNARTALRLVRGWSQPYAADQWNLRWPEDPKTLKNFSYWENWPSETGREPNLRVLTRLAELYCCDVADLVADIGRFAERDRVAMQLPMWLICRRCGTAGLSA